MVASFPSDPQSPQEGNLGILAFEAAAVMARLVSLHRSLSDREIRRLKSESIMSRGVAYLNSTDHQLLLHLALAEIARDLDLANASIARFGHDVNPGSALIPAERQFRRVERYLAATASLSIEMDLLVRMEGVDGKVANSGPIRSLKPPPDLVRLGLKAQRLKVQRLKEKSLWNLSFKKVVRLMSRAASSVSARLCAISSQLLSNNRLTFCSPIAGMQSTTLGGSGLALRYADVVVMAERFMTTLDAKEAAVVREELFEMLPLAVRGAVRGKLREEWRRMERGEADIQLAEGWREGVRGILGWLGPVAKDTLRWDEERSMDRRIWFEPHPRVPMMQTLHFSDREKTEAAITEVLVGLSLVCWYEETRH